MEPMELGTKVFLQPAKSFDTESVVSVSRKLNLKAFSKKNRSAYYKNNIEILKYRNANGNMLDKKKIAQELYYSQNERRRHTIPVHARLGGPEYKRRGFKHIPGFNQETYVKPRMKKGSYGIWTAKYHERAQKFIRRQQSFLINVNNTGAKYPIHFHSVKKSVNPEIQEALKNIQEQYDGTEIVNHDEPLYTDDVTIKSLHFRFSLLP